jgi:hypothetical protein
VAGDEQKSRQQPAFCWVNELVNSCDNMRFYMYATLQPWSALQPWCEAALIRAIVMAETARKTISY